jgi:hypothetical protein
MTFHEEKQFWFELCLHPYRAAEVYNNNNNNDNNNNNNNNNNNVFL